MEILYFGNICDEILLKKQEKKNKQTYKMAQYNYEKAFCSEITKQSSIKIISLNQQEYFPQRKIGFFRNRKKFLNTNIEYIHYINIPFIKELCYFFNTCLKILFWEKKNKKEKKKCIFANLHYAPVSLAIVLMGNLLKIKKVITFTDLSLYTYSEEKIKKMKIYKKCIIRPYIKLINKLQESYDLYILFSKPMNEIVNPNNKPFIVMEGIYNPESINLQKVSKKHSIVYAGKLNKEIGIDKILEIFKKIKDPKLELWFLGNGDMKEEIIKESKIDSRIKYLGFKKRQEVFEYLKMAKIVINLRNPKDTYTKYSFPSKTFEYMVSGTPYLTTKLDGIPKEYEKYLYIVEYDDDKIIKAIEKILNTEEKALEFIGNEGRNFILQNKNPEKQVKKIKKFLETNI